MPPSVDDSPSQSSLQTAPRDSLGAKEKRVPAAVLWDMDGTLIDSEPYWIEAETELTAVYGRPWSHEQGLQMVGQPLTESAEMLQRYGVQRDIPEIIDFLITRVIVAVRREVPWQPGAQDALAGFRAQGIPCALVTMSYKIFADAFVEHTAPGTFSAVVSGDEVVHGKPHPEAYLRAAELLGVDIADCLVIEDSPVGIGSALASGAVPVGIEALVPLPDDPSLNCISALSDLTPSFVDRIMRGEVLDLR